MFQKGFIDNLGYNIFLTTIFVAALDKCPREARAPRERERALSKNFNIRSGPVLLSSFG